MKKTRDLFKKTGDLKGTFYIRMDIIKDRNGKDLTEAEEMKKRWQEYTEEWYKKGSNDPDNHDGVGTHLELDILEYEVKWALGRNTMNKANGADGIPGELFKILKDDAVKVLHSIHSKFRKLSSGHRTGKDQFSFQFQRKAMLMDVQTTVQLHLFHMLARLGSKPFKLGISSMWTKNFQMYKLGLEETEELEIKLPTFIGSWIKQRNSRKAPTSLSLTTVKPLNVWITKIAGNS